MLLSICIPTHHGRAGVLKEAVDSIVHQFTEELKGKVELCVSDNASEDGTAELIRDYIQKYPDQVVYRRNEVDKGFPFNICSLVEMSRGEFCWLVGSDDHLVDGALAEVLDILSSHSDTTGLSFDKFYFEADMSKEAYGRQSYFLPDDPERMCVYTSADEIALNFGMTHTFISTNVFSRKRWMDVLEEIGFEQVESQWYYPHVYMLGHMVKKHPKWVWHPERLVKYRTANDTSLDYLNKEWHTHSLRVLSEITKTWKALHGRKSIIYRELMNKHALCSWQRESVRFYKTRTNFKNRDELRLLVGYTKHLHFVSGFWSRTFPALLTPRFLLGRGMRAKAVKLRWKLGLGTKEIR